MTKIIKKRNNNPTNAASIFKFNSADNADTFAEEIFNTVREPLLLLDEELRVVKANRSFYDYFKVSTEETIGTLIYDLGNQQWNIPKLRKLLETILPEKTTFDDYEVEHDFHGIGKRIMLLNARQIERTLDNEKIILLAIKDITERMQTEKVFKESEERFRSLFESSTIGIYRTTPDGQILLANPTLVKMLGYSSFEKLAARNLEKDGFEPTYERKQFLEKLEKYGEVKGLEATWDRTDGTVIYIRESAKAIRDSNGKTLYYDGTVEDITERKQAEKALFKSENELQVILESTADGILAINNNGKVIKTNKRFAELWRIPKSLLDTEDHDALLNYVLAQLVNPEEFLSKVQLLYESTEEGRDILYFKDGRIFERYSAPLTIDDSSIGRVWSFRDITGRKRAEEALRKSNEKYSGIFENIQDVYFETSINGTILEVSPSMEIISKGQYRRNDLIGKSMNDIYSDAGERDSLISILRQKGSVSEYEVTFKNRDGSLIPCSVLAKLFYDEKGQPEKIVGSIRDITERKQAEEALRISEERYRIIMNSIKLGISLVDMNHKIIMTNSFFAELFKKPASDFVGKYCFMEYEKRKAICPHCPGMLTMASGKYAEVETEGMRDDGSRFSVLVRTVPTFASDGTMSGFVEVVEDITERKLMEEALLRINKAVEGASDAICMSDPQGHHFYHNKSFTEIFEYTAEELEAAGGGPAVYKDKNVAREVFNTIMRGGLWSGEVDMLSRSGRILVVLLRADAIKDANGEIVGLVGMHTDITERKRADDALHESEEKYRNLIDNMNDGIFISDEKGIIKFANNALARIHGFDSPDKLLNKDFMELVEPSARKRILESFQNGIQLGDSIDEIEMPIVNPNGSIVYVLVRSSIIRDGQQIIGMSGIVRDITQRKLAEEALLESEARLTDAMKIAKLSTWEYNFALDRFTFNDQFYSLFHTTAELEGGYTMSSRQYALKFIYQDDWVMVKKEMRKALETPNPAYTSYMEYRVVYKTGEKGYFTANIRIEKDADNRTIKARGVNQDITERKWMEETLLRVNKAVESSSDAICMSDSQGHHFYHNKAFTEVFGYTTEEMEAAGGGQIIYIDKNVAREVFDVTKNGGAWNGEVEMLSKSKRKFIVSLRADAITDANEAIVGLVEMNTDITQQKRAEEKIKKSNEQLLKLNAEKDKFFSIIAHDLKSPFSGFMNLTEIMATESQDFTISEFAEFSHDINESAVNLYKLLENLLEWASIQQGVMSFNLQPYNLFSIVSHNIPSITDRAAQKDISIINQVEESI